MSIVKKPGSISTWYLPGILSGMAFTFGKMIKNIFNQDKMPTLNYPEEQYKYGPRFKGNHVLTVKKDGSIRCTACMLCATNCPVDAVRMGPEWQTPGLNGASFSYDIRHLAYRPQLKGGIVSRVDEQERHNFGI